MHQLLVYRGGEKIGNSNKEIPDVKKYLNLSEIHSAFLWTIFFTTDIDAHIDIEKKYV